MPTRISYDGMSRLTAAGYLENGKRNNHFSTSYKYDLMGNILSLRREGLLNSGSYGTIDDLTYSYKGNQVVKIDDAAEESPSYKGAMHFRDYADEETEYTYDANGNMLTDSNKGITSIDYNVLDLPQCISTKSRVLFKENSNDTIYYTYSADGTKLRSTYKKAEFRVYPYNPETSLTSLNVETGLNVGTVGMAKPIVKRLKTKYYYCSNLVYDNDNISAILFDGGYASMDDDNGIVMHFYVKDHLGSNRLVVDGNGNIEEVNHYYPFGALMGDRCGVSRNKYKYIGKELDTMYGWNMLDHWARWYDAVIIRWPTIDFYLEKYYSLSPYVICADNPICIIDNDGRKLRYKNGTSIMFKRDFKIAVNYLKEHKVDGILAKLEKLDNIIYIVEQKLNECSNYKLSENTIYWEPNVGVMTTDGVLLSPTTVLNHEADHALQGNINMEKFIKDTQTANEQYGNNEEKRVIEGSEQNTAKALEEIKEGEVTRVDHLGIGYNTEGPTSVVSDDVGIIVTPQKK